MTSTPSPSFPLAPSSSTSTGVLLQINHLSLAIDQKVILKDVNLHINANETLALIGESGSGKTMTGLTIMGLQPETSTIESGSINFSEENVLSMTPQQKNSLRGNRIAMIFQDPGLSLNPVKTIKNQLFENIKQASKKTNEVKSKVKVSVKEETPASKEHYQKALSLLQEVQLHNPEQYLKSYPHQLSGGQKQRIVIAMALAFNPELLIADEPTTAVDAYTQQQILELLQKIQQKRNLAILLITHDLGAVHKIADRVSVIRHGEMIETLPAKQFFQAAKHPYSQLLLKSLPSNFCFKEDASTNNHVLKLRHCSVTYPPRNKLFKRDSDNINILSNCNFSLKENENIAIVGQSGSGKTTLAKFIMRILAKDAIEQGQLFLGKRTVNSLSQKQLHFYRQKVQMIFQDPYASLNPKATIFKSLSEGIIALQPPQSIRHVEHQCKQLLQQVGLDDSFLERYPNQLSGGERQRVTIARAISVKPKILICDEPTSALDASLRHQAIELLLELQQEQRLSMIFITHDLSLLPTVADRVMVLYQGKIVEVADCKTLMTSPKHSHTKDLLATLAQVEILT